MDRILKKDLACASSFLDLLMSTKLAVIQQRYQINKIRKRK